MQILRRRACCRRVSARPELELVVALKEEEVDAGCRLKGGGVLSVRDDFAGVLHSDFVLIF